MLKFVCGNRKFDLGNNAVTVVCHSRFLSVQWKNPKRIVRKVVEFQDRQIEKFTTNFELDPLKAPIS